jgi:hypothetical protein
MRKYRVTLTDLYDHETYVTVETDWDIEEYIKTCLFSSDVAFAKWIEL